MKIGILTFFFAHNYGAMLQAYALKKYINELSDNQAVIIPYQSEKMRVNDSPFPEKGDSLRHILSKIIKYPRRHKQYCIFEQFKRTYLSEHNCSRFDANKYDVIVVGSDQVWNTGITYDDYNYFLPGICSKKYSYAASIGTNGFGDIDKDYILSLLNQFSGISVREDQAREYLHSQFDLNATLCVDPVFLINQSCWNEFLERPKNLKSEKYILYYSLQQNDDLINSTKSFASDNSLDIVSIHPHSARQKIPGIQLDNVGPREFIYLIKNAEVIASNSFHAFAFSVIFDKKIIYSLHSVTGNRVSSLVEQLDLNPTLLYSSNMIDCSGKKSKLNALIDGSKDYLRRIVDEN